MRCLLLTFLVSSMFYKKKYNKLCFVCIHYMTCHSSEIRHAVKHSHISQRKTHKVKQNEWSKALKVPVRPGHYSDGAAGVQRDKQRQHFMITSFYSLKFSFEHLNYHIRFGGTITITEGKREKVRTKTKQD